jgi:hypothetical protein
VTIGYVISAYRLPGQLVRLVHRLRTQNSHFVVHVDRKTDDRVFAEMVAGTRELGCVDFVERHVCHWGGFGHVLATLKGIERLYADGIHFDYVVLLTGQDYPLRSARAIERHLAEAAGRSFMRYWPLPRAAWSGRGGLDRIERWHLVWRRPLHLRVPLFRRHLPGGLAPWGGAPYWCLGRDVVDHVWSLTRADPRLARFFEHVWIPDEIFFPTLVLNSPLRDVVINDDLRYVDWSRPTAPAIFGREDFEVLMASGKLFARKFDTTVDREILDLLDKRIDELDPAL